MYTKNLILSLIILSLFPFNGMAQEANNDLDGLVNDTKSDLLVVVGGGLAGAVLGLSTLSFVEEPKEHTKNIIMGASIGIIAGVAFVAFSQASKTQESLYGTEAVKVDGKSFGTLARSGWHYSKVNDLSSAIISPYQLGVNLTF